MYNKYRKSGEIYVFITRCQIIAELYYGIIVIMLFILEVHFPHIYIYYDAHTYVAYICTIILFVLCVCKIEQTFYTMIIKITTQTT